MVLRRSGKAYRVWVKGLWEKGKLTGNVEVIKGDNEKTQTIPTIDLKKLKLTPDEVAKNKKFF